MYQNSVSIAKRWYSTRQNMRERERNKKRIYLLYGSSEVVNTASLPRAGRAVNSAKKLV